MRTRLQKQLAAAVQASNPSLANYIRTVPLGASTVALRQPSPDPEGEPCRELPPIHLRISAQVNVARDSSIIVLSRRAWDAWDACG
jgi:hypothetical protein